MGIGLIETVSELKWEGIVMYMGQIMMIAGGAMIAFSIGMMLVLTAVFGKNKKKLIREIYGEIEERDG